MKDCWRQADTARSGSAKPASLSYPKCACAMARDALKAHVCTFPDSLPWSGGAFLARSHMKRCLFCKNSSDTSRSVEHVLPESVGNTRHVLPRGVVCDTCNNYFARKVEDPFVNSAAVRSLRASQGIPNKKNRLIGQPAIALGRFPVTIYRPHNAMGIIDVPSADGIRALLSAKSGTLIVAAEHEPPSDHVVSRFLAKVALEALALLGSQAGLGLDELIDHPQLDLLRDHARKGDPRLSWPYSIRRIYDPDKAWTDPDGVHQRVNEYDFIVTGSSEWFFVLAIFGLEFAINLGGPEIDGYHAWLKAHDDVSPLYFGKNAHPEY
jgi:hypothetical protein